MEETATKIWGGADGRGIVVNRADAEMDPFSKGAGACSRTTSALGDCPGHFARPTDFGPR